MNQIEIVKAILAGEVLDIRYSPDDWWYAFNSVDSEIEQTLQVYITRANERPPQVEFRIRPKPKTYQSRAYIINEDDIYHWVSTSMLSQDDIIAAYRRGEARWIEETQTKEYA